MEYFENSSCAGSSAKTLSYLPKKLNGRIDANEREGWGLLACEDLKFTRFIISALTAILLTFAFAACWIWWWKSPYDLQNATVPMLLLFSFVQLYFMPQLCGARM